MLIYASTLSPAPCVNHHSIQRIGSSGLHTQHLQPCKVQLIKWVRFGCAEHIGRTEAEPFCKIFTENCNPIGIGSFENTNSVEPSPLAILLSSLNTTLGLHIGWNLPTRLSPLSAIVRPALSCYNGCLQYTLDLCEGMKSLSCRPSVCVVCRCVRRRPQV